MLQEPNDIGEKLRRPLRKAERAVDELDRARSFDEALEAWSDFLIYWRRCFNRCDAWGKRRLGRDAWHQLAGHVQSDPVLVYLWEARNADEHGLADVASQVDKGIQITSVGSIYIQNVVAYADDVLIDYTPNAPGSHPVVTLNLAGLRMEAILDRGREIAPVPTSHKGEPLELVSPPVLARLGLEYIQSLVSAVDPS